MPLKDIAKLNKGKTLDPGLQAVLLGYQHFQQCATTKHIDILILLILVINSGKFYVINCFSITEFFFVSEK